MKMHNPNIPAKAFTGKSHLGNYSDSMLELDSNIGKVMDEIRADAPNTIVIITADNGAWQDAYPDAGTVPFRGEKGSPFEGGCRVPGIMWWPDHIPAGRALWRNDVAHRLLGNAGDDGRPHPAAARRVEGQRRQADLFRQHRQQRLHPGQGEAFGARRMDLYRRRNLRRRARRHRRRSRQARHQNRLEIPLYRQGHLARADSRISAPSARSTT